MVPFLSATNTNTSRRAVVALPLLVHFLLTSSNRSFCSAQTTNNNGFNLEFVTNTGDPSIQCRRFFAVNPDTNQVVDEAGSLCLVLNDNNDASSDNNDNTLTISYVTVGDWVMKSTSAWLGPTLDDLPTNRDGEPQLRYSQGRNRT